MKNRTFHFETSTSDAGFDLGFCHFQPVVGSICPLLVLLVMWDLMIANYWWLVFHKTYRSYLEVACVLSGTMYPGQRQVLKGICECMGPESTENILFITHAIGLAKIYSTWKIMCARMGTFRRSRRWLSVKKLQSLIYIYIYIYYMVMLVTLCFMLYAFIRQGSIIDIEHYLIILSNKFGSLLIHQVS